MMFKEDVYLFELKEIEELLSLVYNTFKEDEESNRFITFEEMMTSIKYFAKSQNVYCTVSRNKDNDKFRSDGRLHDSPDTGSSDLKKARELAKETPCLMLFKERGAKKSWNGRAFWWPVLVAPQNVPKTIYASKKENKKISLLSNKEE